MRDAVGELLPAEVFTRRKAGFAAPIDRWLRNELLGVLRETLLAGPLGYGSPLPPGGGDNRAR